MLAAIAAFFLWGVLPIFWKLLGFLPPFLILRGRIWRLNRRLLMAERPTAPPVPVEQVESGGAAL